ncbi:B12-binding domain-containing radical SAM protein [Candidatus Omnitrophota bacterium]
MAEQRKKILLINPSYSFHYLQGKTRACVLNTAPINLATIAAPLLKNGHIVEILDLNKADSELPVLLKKLSDFNPDYAAITFTTPLAQKAMIFASEIKKFNKVIMVIAGGVHATSFPEEVLRESDFDIVVVGEGDFVLSEIVENNEIASVGSLMYKNNGSILSNPRNKMIGDLDIIPYPAWNLYDLKSYKVTRLMIRENPAGWIETSRGCIYNCSFCNKNIAGRTFRVKSPQRVVDEMEYMLSCGFKEIHIVDDSFTTDMKRAEVICDKIIKRGLKFPWATVTGIRADRVNLNLLKKMKEAGCYRVYYGIESGNQQILDGFGKGETIDDVRKAVRESQQAGLEVFGFFMLALPGETEETMEDTINFAKELDLDMAKMTITVPFPATPLYEELDRKGFIKTKEWSKYNTYVPAREVYTHPTVDWNTVDKYFNRFYREFYLRPSFITKRFFRSLMRGQILSDIKYFLQTPW